MKKGIVVLGLLLNQLAFAQSEINLQGRFAGYTPTVMESTAQVDKAFAGLNTEFRKFNILNFQAGTQCTQRAETWSYGLDKINNVKLEKVFVFYTHAFKDYYRKTKGEDFQWWFHVAPYVLAKNATGAIEERVLDKEFADRSLTMKDWTDLFIDSKEKCIENVPFANFEGDVSASGASYNKSAHCYIVRAPMYDMYPADIDARERGLRPQMDWDMGQVKTALHALTAGPRHDFMKQAGLR